MNKYFISKLKVFWMTLEWGARIGFMVLAFVLIFSVTSSVYQFLSPRVIEVEKWKTVTETKWKTRRVEVPVEVIKEKEKIIEKLKLPDWVKDKEILGETTIDPSEGKTRVVGLIDPSSGKFDFLAKPLAPSFVDLRRKVYLGVDYSPLHSLNQGAYRVFGEFEAGRIWRIKPYVRGEVDEKGNYRVSGGVRAEL